MKKPVAQIPGPTPSHGAIHFGAFAFLAMLVVLNVGVHYSGLPSGPRIALHLFLAAGQAVLIAFYSMHLVNERRIIFAVMGFTLLFCTLLFLLSLLAWYDRITPAASMHYGS